MRGRAPKQVVSIRADSEELAAWREAAADEGMTLSHFARRALERARRDVERRTMTGTLQTCLCVDRDYGEDCDICGYPKSRALIRDLMKRRRRREKMAAANMHADLVARERARRLVA